jgi:hypothetical protein
MYGFCAVSVGSITCCGNWDTAFVSTDAVPSSMIMALLLSDVIRHVTAISGCAARSTVARTVTIHNPIVGLLLLGRWIKNLLRESENRLRFHRRSSEFKDHELLS